MLNMGRLLTLANLALELGGMLATGRGERGSPLLLLKYGLTVVLIVLTALLGLTFLSIAVVYSIWPEADVVTVFAVLGGVFVVACLGLVLFLSTQQRPFREDPKPVLPDEPGKLVSAFLRGLGSR